VTTIGLIVHHGRQLAGQLALDAAGWLEGEGHEVRVLASDAQAIGVLVPWALADERFADGLGLAVSIGGDGTMLRTVRLVSHAGTPVLGVNVGHLGYLTEVEAGLWREALLRVLAGEYEVEERMTLDVALVGPDGPTSVARTALNDAVVEKLEAGHTVRVGVSISHKTAISYAADALIVATPTGSTAYSLSAGGPLLSPRLDALLVTPVAPHSLFGRSMVLARDEVVHVEVLAGSAILGVDGQHCGHLTTGDVVECRASARPARLVSFGERDFWQILKTKFGLNGS